MGSNDDPTLVIYGRPNRGRDLSHRPARGRMCAEVGCTTVLSTYNSADVCWLHSPALTPSQTRQLRRETRFPLRSTRSQMSEAEGGG
jgi:hypothetical protein